MVVVKDGEVILHSSVSAFFRQDEMLDDLHIEPPMIIKMRRMLEEKGIDIEDDVLSVKDMAKALKRRLKKLRKLN